MAKKKTATKPKISFEQNLVQLEEIVDGLESGDLPLEEAINKYEAGIVALKECYAILNEAEKKIETISRSKAAPKKKKKVDLVDTDGDLLVDDDGEEDDSLLF
jgi:exodeoxyribonuclease VII small subunit